MFTRVRSPSLVDHPADLFPYEIPYLLDIASPSSIGINDNPQVQKIKLPALFIDIRH